MSWNKTATLIAASLAVLFAVSSCKDSPTSAVHEEDIVGKWIIQSVTVNGSMSFEGMSITMDTTMSTGNSLSYLHFYPNHTYLFSLDESFMEGLVKRRMMPKLMQTSTDTGTWSLSGSRVSLTSMADDTTITMDVRRDGAYMKYSVPVKMNDMGFYIDMVETFNTVKE
jgi:hypothetical protein